MDFGPDGAPLCRPACVSQARELAADKAERLLRKLMTAVEHD